MPDHAETARAVASVALLRGQFTLRSGRTSTYYLDKYLFTTRPEILAPVATLLARRVQAMETAAGAPAHRLAGAELGGIPLVTAVALELRRPTVLVRNQRKDYGTSKQVEGALEKGERVILIEDVATTGGQALEAAAALRALGAQVIGVVATIDRGEGAAAAVAGAGLRFDALFNRKDLGIEEE